jgi:PPOX class probable F420-dependent enzyme
MKIVNAIPTASSMTREEVSEFLKSRLNLQLATIDENGDPNIQPVWFDFDKDSGNLMIMTPKLTKKIKNLQKRPNIYFSIDDESFPYKGIKGKGVAKIIENPEETVPIAEKISKKYLGTVDHDLARMIIDSSKKGNHVLVKITPKFFSTWDFGKI